VGLRLRNAAISSFVGTCGVGFSVNLLRFC